MQHVNCEIIKSNTFILKNHINQGYRILEGVLLFKKVSWEVWMKYEYVFKKREGILGRTRTGEIRPQ